MESRDPTLSFQQCLQFRIMLFRRVGGLRRQGYLPALPAARIEELGNRILRLVADASRVQARRLAAHPRGMGDACWCSIVTRISKRVLGSSAIDLAALRLSLASALRLALLNGHEGLDFHCWDADEAVAYARRFIRGRQWNVEVARPAILATGREEASEELWTATMRAFASRKLRFTTFKNLRRLRQSYDSYTSPSRDLIVPWPPQPAIAETEGLPVAA